MGLYVYILKCSDKSYYVGVTNNPESRLMIHNQGSNTDSFTYTRRPVVMVWNLFFHSNLEAIAWEKKLKGWTRKKKEALINGEFNLLHELAKCQNYTNSSYYNGYNPSSLEKTNESITGNETHTSTTLSVTTGNNEVSASTTLSVTEDITRLNIIKD